MKIAVITEDGTTVSQHFGRAPYYMVVTVENGKVVNREQRDKAGHHTFGGAHEAPPAPGERHGFDAAARDRHATMADTISDCQVLVAGGMGWGAQVSMKERGIETIVTDVENIDQAVKLYIGGNLPNIMERLH
jgi:predicted Fe-Mo cluster-binding NifX family protein